MEVFPHDKFTEEVQNWVQAMAKLLPPPPKVENWIVVSQQGVLYNGVAIAFGDRLVKGGGGGGGRGVYL